MRKLLVGFILGIALSVAQAAGDIGDQPLIRHHLGGSGNLASAITVRDYFATQALTGLLAGRHGYTNTETYLDEYAPIAYKLADAMLRARKAK